MSWSGVCWTRCNFPPIRAYRGSLFQRRTCATESSLFVFLWLSFSAAATWNKCDYIKCNFPVVSLTFLSMFQEANNEVGAAGPSGDFEIRDDRRNDLGQGVVPLEPDLIGNTVDGGSSAAQLPQKNILERKEVLIGRYPPVKLTFIFFGMFFSKYLSRSSGSVSVCHSAFLPYKPLGSHLLDQQITCPRCLLYSFPAYRELPN